MDEETRKLLEEALKDADPELIEKYGNPLDENDPRMWTPSKRAEEGVSLEDQVKFLGLDVEAQAVTISNLMKETNTLRDLLSKVLMDSFKEQIEKDPQGAMKKLAEYGEVILAKGGLTDAIKGSYGPLEDSPDTPVRYAGSTKGIAPDQMVDTPNGMIRADQIPGYQNDPNWKPSPDWVDANCMCEAHQHKRAASDSYNPFGINPNDPPNGMYL